MMCGVVRGAGAVIAASVDGSDAGGPDSGRHGASFANDAVGPVGGACAGGCGGTAAASGTASGSAADTAWGVAGKEVSALVSPSTAFSRCHRSGSAAWGSVIPASGDMS